MSVPVLSPDADATAVRSALVEAADTWKQIRSKPQDEITDDDRSHLKSIAGFIAEADNVEKLLSRFEDEDRRQVRELESLGPRAGNDVPRRRPGDILDNLFDDEKFQQFAKSGRAQNEPFIMELKGSFHQRTLLEEGDVLTAFGDGVTGPGVLVPQGSPTFIPPRNRRLFVRDLIPSSPTTLNAVPSVREINTATNELGASGTPEGAAKPEVTLEFEEQLIPVRKIAAWVPITTEMIEDAPTLRAYINARLLYMIKLREEIQILSGAGTSADILGILNDPDIQTQSNVGTNDLPATVAAAYGKLENVDAEADAVAIHPITFWAAVASRHTAPFDGGTGVGPAPSNIPNITWGLTPLRTRGVTQGTFLAGAFAMGAHIWDRSEVVIRVGNQHSDYFVKNKMVVLAEERLALSIWRPEWFCSGAVTVAGG